MPSEGRPLGLGLVGCGEVTRAKHLPALREVRGARVMAVADPDARRREDVARRFGIGCQAESCDELLAMPGVDAVGVCTPPGTHADLAIAAMRAGKHVWIDKPVALNVGDCARMMDQAARSGVVAMAGFHMRFHRLVSQARELLREGVTGPLESVRVVWHSPRGDENTPEWKTHRESGGGSLVEIAVHHFDLLRYLLGTEIEEVFVFGRDGVRDDESAVIAARMANGILASGEFSERSPHEIEFVASGAAGVLRLDCLQFDGLDVRGTREAPGKPVVRLRRMARTLRCLPAGVQAMRRGGDYRDSYRRAWQSFVDAVRAGRQPEVTLEDGLRAIHAANAAVHSRLMGTRAAVPAPARRRVAQDAAADLTFSVVIPTYRRPDHARGVLESLLAQDFPPERFEVVLVDDGGQAPLDGLVGGYNGRLRIRLIKQRNGGCGPARQHGAEAARGVYLAFTDDDCRPASCWLSQLYAALRAHEGCAVCGPTVNGLPGSLYSEASQRVVDLLSEWDRDGGGETAFAPTSNLAFPAAEFRGVGGIDRRWHIAGGEDRDLCARWLAAGHSLFYAPDARVDHYHRLSAAGFLRQHFNYGRGALRIHRRAGNTGTYLWRRAGFYVRLLLPPAAKYGFTKAAGLALAVAVSQLATGAGVLAEAVSQRDI